MFFPFILFFTGIFATASSLQVYINKYEIVWLNDVGLCLINVYGIFTSIVIIDKFRRMGSTQP